MATDRQQLTDVVSASIEAVPVEASFPCPECGAESRPHGEAPRHDESERICSAIACREVQPAPEEVERSGPNDESPRFPCVKCGRETKLYRSGRAGDAAERVCSATDCRKVFTA